MSIAISNIIAVIGMSVSGCQGQIERYTGSIQTISIGATTQELSSLIWIAEEKGYFEENGLDATVKA